MNQDFHTVGEAVDVQQTPKESTSVHFIHVRIKYLEIRDTKEPRLRLPPKTHHSNHAQALDLQNAPV